MMKSTLPFFTRRSLYTSPTRYAPPPSLRTLADRVGQLHTTLASHDCKKTYETQKLAQDIQKLSEKTDKILSAQEQITQISLFATRLWIGGGVVAAGAYLYQNEYFTPLEHFDLSQTLEPIEKMFRSEPKTSDVSPPKENDPIVEGPTEVVAKESGEEEKRSE